MPEFGLARKRVKYYTVEAAENIGSWFNVYNEMFMIKGGYQIWHRLPKT